MKLLFSVIRRGALLAAAAMIFSSSTSNAAVAFTVSPAQITNDLVGKITLTITGLAAEQTVRIDRFADLNGNGAIDSNEPLVLSFAVTDGHLSRIGGVRNINVPGDEDATTNGQIRVELATPGVERTELRAVGKSIFRVSSEPVGAFAPLTQPFTTVQRVRSQGLTGQLSDNNGQPIANSLIIVGVNALDSEVLISATDANGRYTIYTSGGFHILELLKRGIINDESLSVTAGCNQLVTYNRTFPAGTLIVAGKVTGVDGTTTTGLGGVVVEAKSTNNLRVWTFTDATGAYSLLVTGSNVWGVRLGDDGPARLGYVGPDSPVNVTVINSSVSNVNFQLPKATALIYGTITNDLSRPMAGLEFNAFDSAQDASFGISQADGRYSLAVLAGSWYVQNELAGLPGQTADAIVVAGQARNINFRVAHANFPNLSTPTRPSSSQSQFLLLNSKPGYRYLIEATTSLTTPDWCWLLTTNGSSNPTTITDSAATNRVRFYRAMLAP